MALTFTSWNACNDPSNPVLDWSSAAAIEGRLAGRYLEAIEQAIRERQAIVINNESSSSSSTEALSTSSTSQMDTQPLMLAEWIDAVQVRVTALIPFFVNHTIPIGSVSDDPPFVDWSEADILTELGQTRIETHLLLSEWAKQQYEILNLLRWTDYPLIQFGDAAESKDSGTGASRALAEADYQSVASTSGPWGAFVSESGGTWTIQRHYGEAIVDLPEVDTASDLISYAFIQAPDTLTYHNELGTAEDTWFQVHTATTTGGGQYTFPEWYDTGTYPGFAQDTGWISAFPGSKTSSQGVVISKWDIPTGFTFQA